MFRNALITNHRCPNDPNEMTEIRKMSGQMKTFFQKELHPYEFKDYLIILEIFMTQCKSSILGIVGKGDGLTSCS